jgi:outer membrane protein assembly factor BamB
MFRSDDANSGCNLRVRGPEKPVLLWKYKTGSEVMSSPVIDREGRVYAGSHDGNVHFQAGREGELSWRRAATGEAVISTPLLDGDGFFVGSLDGRLYRFPMDGDGKPLFSVDMGDWICASPARLGSLVIVPCRDGSVYAVDAATGRVEWKTPVGKQRYEIQSSPAVFGGRIYVGSGEGGIFCLGGDGRILWRFDTGGPVYASPAIDPAGSLYAGSWDGYFYCLGPSGRLKWKFLAGGEITSSAGLTPGGRVVFGCRDGNIYCLDRTSGQEIWRLNTGSPVESSPAIDREGNVFVGCDGGSLLAISPHGKLAWRFLAGGPILSSPALDEKGRLVFGSEDHFIYCLGEGQ